MFEWGRQSNYTTPSKPSNVPILKHYQEAKTHRTQNRFTLQKHTENLSRMIDTPIVFVVRTHDAPFLETMLNNGTKPQKMNKKIERVRERK